MASFSETPNSLNAPIDASKALGNGRRLLILAWLRDPRAHFRPQVDGDLVEGGVRGAPIAEKPGIAAPTLSEHMRVLVRAGLVRARRTRQWTFCTRDEERSAEVKRTLLAT